MHTGAIFRKPKYLNSEFNFYGPSGTHDCKDNQVFIAVKKDLLNKTILENRTDLVSHPYGMVLDITEREIHTQRRKRTRIVNIYDNTLERGQTWEGSDQKLRQAIQDIPWELIIKGQILIVGDINTYGPIQNL